MVSALDAGRDTTMLMEVVSSHPQIPKDQPCKDARSGTGTPKPAQNVLTGGTSTLMEFVLKSQLSVLLMMPTEHVPGCYSGFTLNNGVCEVTPPQPVSDAGCHTWEAGVCTACSKDWVFDSNNVCRAVSRPM